MRTVDSDDTIRLAVRVTYSRMPNREDIADIKSLVLNWLQQQGVAGDFQAALGEGSWWMELWSKIAENTLVTWVSAAGTGILGYMIRRIFILAKERHKCELTRSSGRPVTSDNASPDLRSDEASLSLKSGRGSLDLGEVAPALNSIVAQIKGLPRGGDEIPVVTLSIQFQKVGFALVSTGERSEPIEIKASQPDFARAMEAVIEDALRRLRNRKQILDVSSQVPDKDGGG